jgi:hypothetical protein
MAADGVASARTTIGVIRASYPRLQATPLRGRRRDKNPQFAGLRDHHLFSQRGPSDMIGPREQGGAVKPTEAQTRIEKLIECGEPFERVETAIERLDRPDDEKAALWLLAWSTQERHVRLRVAKEALASTAERPLFGPTT